MATKTIVEKVCDLTGDPADETIEFGIGGKAFEVDLTKKHADALREILEDYVRVARPAGRLTAAPNGRLRSNGAVPGRGRDQMRAIRDWARQNGHNVSDRGRVPTAVLEQFDATH